MIWLFKELNNFISRFYLSIIIETFADNFFHLKIHFHTILSLYFEWIVIIQLIELFISKVRLTR